MRYARRYPVELAALAELLPEVTDRFWEMHELLFHGQKALEDDDLRRYAGELGLDMARLEADAGSEAVLDRIRRDARSGAASGQVQGTPTLFNKAVQRGGYDAASLLETLERGGRD